MTWTRFRKGREFNTGDAQNDDQALCVVNPEHHFDHCARHTEADVSFSPVILNLLEMFDLSLANYWWCNAASHRAVVQRTVRF